MPDIASFHPQIVHFVIALFFVGLVLRVVSLTGRLAWTRPAGATLLIVSALAAVLAVKSGTDAHGPAERIPGAREMVEHHEETGERARNLMLVVAGIEILGLGFRRREKAQRVVHVAAAAAALYAGVQLYEAAEHGGEVVYRFAGGVGTRSGDSLDLRRLLVAGLYHQSQAERGAGRPEEAARLIEELARQAPEDPTVVYLAIESRLRDRKDAAGALADLLARPVPEGNARLAVRHGLLLAEAHAGAGHADSARAVLLDLSTRFPENAAVRRALEQPAP